jgi:hypothetical protein
MRELRKSGGSREVAGLTDIGSLFQTSTFCKARNQHRESQRYTACSRSMTRPINFSTSSSDIGASAFVSF